MKSFLLLLLLMHALVCSQSLRTNLSDVQFAAWRSNHGDWKEVAQAFVNPDKPMQLATYAGEGVFVNGELGRTEHLVSQQEWGDVRLFIEFMVPEGSNSGVYLMGRYEIQILDSYKKKTDYAGNECGGIYQRWDEDRDPKGYEGVTPAVDASKPPGQWQWFDAVFRAPRFDKDGHKIQNARFESIYHNGKLIHRNVEISGPTRSSLYEDEKPTGPLMLQGDHGPVAFRNIWVAPVDVNPFFAMDTGTRDENHQSYQQQAKMLKELGYDGMDHTGVDDLQDFLAQLDAYGLRLFAVYLDVWADRDRQWFNEGLEQAIEQLKNRDVVLWVPIRSNDFKASEQNGDAAAVKVVREIADLAAAANLKVALYPHSFFLLQTIGDAIRISNKVDRPNVGVTFNLCHWLRTDKSDLEKTLESARSYLKVVTLNGADNEGDWKQLIQPLDVGQFDVFELLSNLKKINYSGPIGLQGYGIGGDVRKNLDRSMDAWVKLNGN